MVKRLHMGRAAEGGVTAAYLAARGFEGPDVVLEGKFGYLDVYARDGDPALLVEGLGTRWDSLNIWFKMFPCHVTAQAPVRAIQQLQREHHFASARRRADRASKSSDKVLSHHADRAPRDVGTAQYSVPFSVALALFRDPADPQAFLDGPNQNPKILRALPKDRIARLTERRSPPGTTRPAGSKWRWPTAARWRSARPTWTRTTRPKALTGVSSGNTPTWRADCPTTAASSSWRD